MTTNLNSQSNSRSGFGPFDDVVFGNGGNDTLRGGDGNDELHGGRGDDRIFGDAGADKLFGDAGNDMLFSFNAQGSANPRQVDSISEASFAADGGSTIDGGSGNDTIMVSHDFHDTMRVLGGDGGDTLAFDGDSNVFTNRTNHINIVNLSAGTGLTPFNRPLSISGIENVTGDVYQDRFIGDAHNNVLDGAGGNDVLDGLGGADNLIGGSGLDTASYTNSESSVSINLFGSFQSGGDAAGDRLIDIENVTGSAHNDVIVGNNLGNALRGGDGNDRLEGAGGGDVLDGGAGIDLVDYHLASEAILLKLGLNGSDGSTIEHGGFPGNGSFVPGPTDVLRAVENANGSNFDDAMTGNQVSNVLNGGKGKDQIDGGAGRDSLHGGDDNDVLTGGLGGISAGAANIFVFDNDLVDGGSGIDRVIYTHNVGAVIVRLGLNGGDGQATELAGRLHSTDVIRSVENVTGSLHSDVITGNEQNNDLFGFAGDDTLNGSAGRDTMTGGIGNDIFKFSALSHSAVPPDIFIGEQFAGDQIVDFNNTSEDDIIDLSAIDADSTTDGDQAFHFAGHFFTGHAGELIAQDTFPPGSGSRGHALLADVDGDRVADFGIDLVNGNDLNFSDADFVL